MSKETVQNRTKIKEVGKMAKEKIKVILVNTSNRNVYVDLDGDKKTDDIIQLGPKAISTPCFVPSKTRMEEIAKEYPKVLVKGV